MRAMSMVTALAVAAALGLPAAVSAQGGPPPQAQKEKQKEKAGPDRRPQGGAARGGPARGQGPERAQEARGRSPGQARDARRGRDPSSAPGRAGARGHRGPPDIDQFNSDLVRRAVRVRSRRHGGGDFDVRRRGGRVELVNGEKRFASMPADVAQALGYWRVARVRPGDEADLGAFDLGDDRDEGAGTPAFCRSGAGHPVWGRAWCIDKGFGLGDDRRFGFTRLEDIRFDPDRDLRDDELGIEDLAGILGDVVLGRLALQALVLGADEPLTGRWRQEPDGPRLLRLRSGDRDIAELADLDRDNELDVLIVRID